MDGDGGDNRVRNWSEIDDDILEVISHRSDPVSMSHLSYSVRDLSPSLERVASSFFPYDLPCLLHNNPFTWPKDTSSDGKVTYSALMPLDGPSLPAPMIFPPRSHWSGYRCNWVAIVGRNIVE